MSNVTEISKEQRYEKFIRSLLNPESFGLSVSAEVRDEARYVLGMKKVETLNNQKVGFRIEEL